MDYVTTAQRARSWNEEDERLDSVAQTEVGQSDLPATGRPFRASLLPIVNVTYGM